MLSIFLLGLLKPGYKFPCGLHDVDVFVTCFHIRFTYFFQIAFSNLGVALGSATPVKQVIFYTIFIVTDFRI